VSVVCTVICQKVSVIYVLYDSVCIAGCSDSISHSHSGLRSSSHSKSFGRCGKPLAYFLSVAVAPRVYVC